MDAITRMAGQPRIEVQRLNVSASETPVEITPDLVAFIEAVNGEDRKLFVAVNSPEWQCMP